MYEPETRADPGSAEGVTTCRKDPSADAAADDACDADDVNEGFSFLMGQGFTCGRCSRICMRSQLGGADGCQPYCQTCQ